MLVSSRLFIMFSLPVAPGFWQSATEGKALFDPVRALIGQNKTYESVEEESSSESQSSPRPTEVEESSEKQDSSQIQSDLNEKEGIETEAVPSSLKESNTVKDVEVPAEEDDERPDIQEESQGKAESESPVMPIGIIGSSFENDEVSESYGEANHGSPRTSVETPEPTAQTSDSVHYLQQKEFSETETSIHPELGTKSGATDVYQDEGSNELLAESQSSFDVHNKSDEQKLLTDRINEPIIEVENIDRIKTEEKEELKTVSHIEAEAESSDDNQGEGGSDSSSIQSGSTEVKEGPREVSASELSNAPLSDEASMHISSSDSHDSDLTIKAIEMDQRTQGSEKETKEQRLSSGTNIPDHLDSMHELEKVKADMKMMETALQGAARQAQVLHVAKHYLQLCR